MFLTLFSLFLRFLPCINIAEVKWTLPQSDPHFEDKEESVDPGVVEIPTYQKEIKNGAIKA